MGGFFKHDRCIELLRNAVELLHQEGHDDASDAVEQAIALLEARPSFTKVWIVSGAYRDDYEIKGIYPSRELAEAACEAANVALGDSRNNPSWTRTVSEYDVQGLTL